MSTSLRCMDGDHDTCGKNSSIQATECRCACHHLLWLTNDELTGYISRVHEIRQDLYPQLPGSESTPELDTRGEVMTTFKYIDNDGIAHTKTITLKKPNVWRGDELPAWQQEYHASAPGTSESFNWRHINGVTRDAEDHIRRITNQIEFLKTVREDLEKRTEDERLKPLEDLIKGESHSIALPDVRKVARALDKHIKRQARKQTDEDQ